MTDTNLPNSNSNSTIQNNQNDSYINAYTPPSTYQDDNWVLPESNSDQNSFQSVTPSVSSTIPNKSSIPDEVLPSNEDNSSSNEDSKNISSGGSNVQSEKIEDQNIFFLLGVKDGTEEEKDEFLDELQQVIWEDFLEKDVDLLLTEDELAQLNKLKEKTQDNAQQAQEEMVVYLEKLIPDLEDIMLEKALELKEDMFKERIAGLREFYANNQAELKNLDEVESLTSDAKWYSAAKILNDLADKA